MAKVYADALNITPQVIKDIQAKIGTFLYYARAIDITILRALNNLSHTQNKSNQHTLKNLHHLMDYLFTKPNVCICYKASNMQLTADSDAAFLILPLAKSRVGGYFALGTNVPNNGPMYFKCKLLKQVVSSAAEAECAALYHNVNTCILIHYVLEALGHPKQQIPLKTDNSTATAFANNDLKLQHSKTWNKQYW
mmetsp:Transcript_8846/g.12587  ORF Transcript_8846/g.12587 Transcript_8846/m.12587 type:complete len:194 (+) Transcript_8846:562-1143(+)